MKKQTKIGKLALAAETIRSLSGDTLSMANGGREKASNNPIVTRNCGDTGEPIPSVPAAACVPGA